MIDDQLREWVAAYLTQTLNEVEAAAFQQRLEQDESARKFFASQCRQDVLLHQCLEANALRGVKTEQIVRRQSRKKQAKRSRRRSGGGRKKQSSLFMITSIAAAILIFIGWQIYAGQQHVVEPNEHAYAMTVTDGQGSLSDGTLVKSGSKLPQRVALKTEGEGLQLMLKDEASSIALAQHTSVQVQVSDSGTHCDVDSGFIKCNVAEQSAGRKFSVETRLGLLEVLGTVFEVKMNERDMLVSVRKGQVKVIEKSSGTEHHVNAGEQVTLKEKNSEPVAPAVKVPQVRSISLINSRTDTVVPGYETVTEDLTFKASDLNLTSFNLRINCDEEVNELRMSIADRSYDELILPFSAFGDTDGDYDDRDVSPAVYTLKVMAYVDGKPSGPPFVRKISVK